MAVTRIKNNQITDSTITAAKIAAGTLTGGLFASDITLNSNVTITGNLTLQGSADSISATNTYVNDPLVVFNNGFIGAPSYDIGILINRNLTATAPYGSVNAAWVWRESDDAFEGIMTTETGTTTGSINNSGFANLKVGNITANSLSLTTGTLSATGGITGTPISGSTGHFTILQGTAFSTANAVISGGYISALSNATITSGAITTLYAGGLNTANAVITGGYINNLANLTATTAFATNFSSGNISATGTTSGTWSTANVSLYESVNPTTTNSTFYPFLADKTTGNTASFTSTALSYNPSTGALTATSFIGTVSSTVTTSNVSLYQNLTNNTTNATFYPAFYDKSTGNAAAYTNTTVNVNPSTGTLSATQFTGGAAGLTDVQATNIAGTVATANVSLYESVAATTTNASFYPFLSDKTSGNTASFTAATLTHNPSTGALTATSFNGIGNFTTAVATNFSSGNVAISGGYVNNLANVTATSGVIATINASAANVSGPLFTNSLNTANAVISGGYISSLTNATITTASITTATVTDLAATTAVATNFSSGNIRVSGGYISSLTNATITTGTFTTLNASTATAATLNATTANITTLAVTTGFSTANARITGGYADNFPIGANTAATGRFTTLSTSGVATIGGNLVAGSGTVSTSETTGALVVVGGLGVTGAINAQGPVKIYSNAQNTGPDTGALQVTAGGAYISGNLWIDGNLNLSPSGNVNTFTGNSGVFYGNAGGAGALYAGVVGFTPLTNTVLQLTTNLNDFGQVNNQNINPGSDASTDYVATADNGTQETTYINMGIASSTHSMVGEELIGPNDGYVIVVGNAITGGGNLLLGVSDGTQNDIIFSVNGFAQANEYGRIKGTSNSFVIVSTTQSTSTSTGAISVAGGAGIAGRLNVGGNIVASSGTASTNATTGALVVVGGVGISGAVNAGSASVGGTLSATGITSVTNATDSTSTASGALQVTGGASIGGNLWVGGNLYVANIIGRTSTTITVQDPLLYLTSNSSSYNYDIGIYSNFVGGPAGVYGHTGLARDFTTNQWKLFSNIKSEPNNTINWSDAGLIWDSFRAGDIISANTTVSSSTSTGALVISGGAGIAGNLNAGNVTTSMVTGTVMGNVGNFNNLYGTFYGTVTGGANSANSANVSLYQSLTSATVNALHYIAVYDKTTGNAAAYTDNTLTFNPATNTLSATTVNATNSAVTTLNATNFSSGNIVATGTTSGTWSTANVSLYESVTATTTNATFYPFLADKTAGNTASFTSSTLSYNPSTGELTATSLTGNHYGTTAQFTNISTGNAVISGGYISALSNITATTGSFGTATAATINATAGNITTLSAQNFSTANAQITSGSATGLTNFSTTTGQVTNFSTGNAVISGGYISSLANATITTASITTGTFTTLNASTATAATLNATAGNITTSYAQNFSSGNAVITGGSISGLTNLAATTLVATNFSTGNAVISGGYISALANITATTGSFGTTTSGTLNATAGNVTTLSAGNFSTANAVITSGYISALTNATITTASVTNLTSTTAVATNFSSGNIQATGTTSGTWSTANVALYDSIAASTTNATFYPQVVDKASGNVAAYSVGSFTINPGTGLLSATTFSGAGTLSTLTTSGTIISSGNIVAAATTSSTNTTTGALVVRGGAGIAGALNIGTSVTVDGGAYGNVVTTQFASVFGRAVGPNAYSVMQVKSNDGASGMGMQAYAGSAGTIYSNVGINFTTGTTVRDQDVYSGGTTGVLIAANGAIIAQSTIASTTTDTGAVIITGTGGLGVGGAVNIGGNVYADDSVTINGSKTAGMDFVVRGKTDNTLIWARPGSSYDQVVIGNSATTSTLVTGAKLIVNTTDSILIPVGTTSQRPSNSGGTDTAGMFRYNSTSNAIEWYTGSSWKSATSQFTTITDTQFNGDGLTPTFTSSNFASATTNSLIVSINGVLQIPTIAYSLTDSTITFTEAPASGDLIDVRVVTTTSIVSSLESTNGFMGFIVDNNGVYISTGTSSATVFNYYDTTGGFVSNIANVSVASANTVTTLDSISNSVYRSAKYTVQVTNGASYQVAEALVIQNGTTATITTYGVVQTNGNLGVLAATVSGGNTLLQFIAANATNNVRIKKEYMVI